MRMGVTDVVVPIRKNMATDPGHHPVASEIATWLLDNGYPDDWTTEENPPKILLEALVIAIADRDGLSYDEATEYLKAVTSGPARS